MQKTSFCVLLLACIGLQATDRAEATPTEEHRLLSRTALWGTGLTLTAFLLDRSIHREVNPNQHGLINASLDHGDYGQAGSLIEVLGQPWGTVGLSGLFYGVGTWTDSPRARRVGVAGAQATAVAGALVLVSKFVVGRNRPYHGNDVDEFHPFRGTKTSASSFPSGHAAVAFSMASVVADEYDVFWVDALAYGTASLVALGRVYQDRHWASDVTAGAALGIGVGKTARRRRVRREARGSFLSNGRGLFYVQRF